MPAKQGVEESREEGDTEEGSPLKRRYHRSRIALGRNFGLLIRMPGMQQQRGA
jgi:hypothetical protein